MFKVYHKYLINIFLIKFLKITMIFFSLICILGILEEISFFKEIKSSGFYPYFLTLLNAPITLFEIFPFIFLIVTQFVLYDLFKNDELNLLKQNGLSNLKIIKIFFFLSLAIGIFNVLVYYNISSKLKFHYSNIKNTFSNDNRYLAMVTDSGLWIKDEVGENTLIIKSNYIRGNYLTDTIINQFDSNFELTRTIQSKKVDITDFNWKVYSPLITKKNISNKTEESIFIETNFNEKKISNLFSNISTLNLVKLIDLKKDFDRLGYSSDEVVIHLLTLCTVPLLYSILTLLAAVIVFNFSKNRSILTHLITGILMSVVIYYMKFIFTSLGTNGKIPIFISIFFPLVIISIISVISLVNINEK